MIKKNSYKAVGIGVEGIKSGGRGKEGGGSKGRGREGREGRGESRRGEGGRRVGGVVKRRPVLPSLAFQTFVQV